MADANPAIGQAYDAVRYPPVVHPQTHPDRLFVNATILGMTPAPVGRCRVLELGCGDGSNLAAIAHAHPDSECVGLDLSAAAVADGQAFAAEVGLKNLSLRAADLMDIGPDFGRFDYIIAHGLYSWVPPAVQDKTLEISRNNLVPSGISYVSYSAYPGAHFRHLMRGLMLYHTRQFTDPLEKVQQARGILNFVANSQPPQRPTEEGGEGTAAEKPAAAYARRRNQVYRELIRNELDHMSRTPPAIIFHDDLSGFNAPVYFHEFAAHAARHGLQYLCEADFIETQPPVPGAPTSMSPEVTRVLDQLPPDDLVVREQYADFIKCRQFRQTLLCHAAVPVSRPPAPDRVRRLYVSSAAQPVSPSMDFRSPVPEEFALPSKGTFKVNHPVAKAALAELGAAWPRRLHFDEMLARCRQRVGAATDGDDRALADLLLTGYAANILALHAFAPPIAAEAGERPLASALSRAQAARRPLVSNLVGTTVDLSGAIPRRLLRLLDGTRDRAALAAELARLCLRDGAAPEQDGRPVTDPAEVTNILRREMDHHLSTMARLALLIG